MNKFISGLKRFKYNWSKESTNDSLSHKEIMAYTTSALGQNFWWGLKGYMYVFYTLIMGLSPAEVGLMLLIIGIWDAVNDPLMGAIIDKTKTKWGKLRPYLLWTAAPIGLLTFSLLFNPTFLNYGGKLVYIYVTYVLWEMCYTISDVPFSALPTTMTSNTVERTKLVTVAQYGSNLGLVIPGILPFFLGMVPPSQHGIIYTTVALVLSVLGALLFGQAFFFVKERVPPETETHRIRDMFKIISKSKPMMILLSSEFLTILETAASGAAYFFFFFAFLNGTGLSFISKIFPGHEGLGLMSLLGVVMGVPTFIAMAFTPKIARYISMRSIIVIAGLARSTSLILAFLIGFDSPWKLILMIVMFMFSNIPNDMTGIARRTMFMDSVDYIEWQTGVRAEGICFSFNGLVVKLKFAFSNAIIGALLVLVGINTKVLGGLEGEAYDAALYSMLGSINLKGLFALYTLVPAIGKLLSLSPYIFYDFVGKKKEDILVELSAKRVERAKELGLEYVDTNVIESNN